MSLPSEPSTQIPELGNFQLGPWMVCRSEGTLSLAGRSIRLEPRVMDLLVYLAAHSGRVVPKEELIAAVWNGSFVEEGALSQAVHSLRKALGDDARQPRYIQTLPKRGYRVVADVSPFAGQAPPVTADQSPARESLESLALDAEQPARLDRRARFLLLALGLGLAAVLWLAWARFSRPHSPTTEPTRIAVLPFENLGRPEDSFFADGLTEEITKDLASLSGLQVISRTSTLHYKGSRMPLTEIGRELKVAYVLEGTVQWSAGPGGRRRVKIIPQLIRVADDAHVWASAFEREVEDIFEVQAEISQRVTGPLGVTLLPEEKSALQRAPTKNLEAYRAHLRGLDLRNQPYYSEEHIRQAVPMFERAVELDPDFAEAWAELSQTHSYLAFNADPSPGRVEAARRALSRATALASDLDAVRLAQAYFSYRCLNDYETANEQLSAALQRSPNNPEILQALGFVLRRQGQLAEAIEDLERSFSLDPHTVKLAWAIAETYAALREYEQADRAFARAISLAPDQAVYWEERTLNRLAWTGDVGAARAILEKAPIPDDPGLVPISFQLDLYERDYRRALARLSSEPMREVMLQAESRVAILAVIARERMGDSSGARAAAEATYAVLAARVARFPNEVFYRGFLAVALAQLGRREEALREAEEAVRRKNGDAFSGPRLVELQAMTDAILGRRRESVTRLAQLLSKPYQCPISTADLRLNPVWDTLRGDPGFEALLQRAKN